MLRTTYAVVLAVLLIIGCACVPRASGSSTSQDPDQPAYEVRDTGVRCVTHPCLSWSATDTRSGTETAISDIDLSGLALDPDAESRTMEQVLSGAVRVHGTIRTVPDAGPAGDGVVLVVIEVLEAGGTSSAA